MVTVTTAVHEAPCLDEQFGVSKRLTLHGTADSYAELDRANLPKNYPVPAGYYRHAIQSKYHLDKTFEVVIIDKESPLNPAGSRACE